jgi:hypothetical protein
LSTSGAYGHSVLPNTIGIVLPSFDSSRDRGGLMRKAEKVRFQGNFPSHDWRLITHCATSQTGTGVPSCPEGNKNET